MSAETPEGAPVGVVKNLSYLAHITIRANSNIIYDILKDKITPIDNCNPVELYERVKIIINGAWIGICDEPYKL